MKAIFTSLAVAVSLPCLASITSGAEPSKSSYQHLKGLEFMIGQWTVEGTTDEGVKFQGTAVHKWVLNKNALSEEVHFTVDGKRLSDVKELIYWDPAKQQIGVFTLSSIGDVLQGQVTIDPAGKCVQAKSGWGARDKRPVEGTLTFEKQGDDTIRAEVKLTQPGRLPLGSSWLFKRVKP